MSHDKRSVLEKYFNYGLSSRQPVLFLLMLEIGCFVRYVVREICQRTFVAVNNALVKWGVCVPPPTGISKFMIANMKYLKECYLLSSYTGFQFFLDASSLWVVR